MKEWKDFHREVKRWKWTSASAPNLLTFSKHIGEGEDQEVAYVEVRFQRGDAVEAHLEISGQYPFECSIYRNAKPLTPEDIKVLMGDFYEALE